jgi:predicted outer membrane repeat protein
MHTGRSKRYWWVLVAWVGLAFAPGAAMASQITVCAGGGAQYTAIKPAIDAASSGDEIVVCNGTYVGVNNTNLDFGGKAITLRSADGPDQCIIDCEGVNGRRAFRFHMAEGATSVVRGFTIQNGKLIDEQAAPGGAILCEGSSPTITNCVFSGNQSGFQGGALACLNGSAPVISHCKFSANSVTYGQGGAIYCYIASPVISFCKITGNNNATSGGGIYCQIGSPVITHTSIIGNVCSSSPPPGPPAHGCGIACYGANLILRNCVIASNGRA